MTTLIYQNNLFTIEQGQPCLIAGYLILRPVEKVTTLADLSSDTLTALGKIMAAIDRSLHAVLKPEKIYWLFFGEVDPTVHFNIFPRTRELAELYKVTQQASGNPLNGARLFDWAKSQFAEQPFEENYVALCEEIKRQINENLRDNTCNVQLK